MLRVLSVAERDILRGDVEQENPKFLECVQDSPNFRPSRLENLPLLGFPVGPDIRGKLRRRVEKGPGEIQDEGTIHDGHCKHAQVVVELDQTRHVETQDDPDQRFFQPFINSLLPFAGFGTAKRLDGDSSGLGLASGNQNDTFLSRAQDFG